MRAPQFCKRMQCFDDARTLRPSTAHSRRKRNHSSHALAERIKALAFDSQVPVVENVPLARALVASVKVGTMIPAELYLAVAEVLAFVIKQRQRAGAGWGGSAAA